MSIITVNETIQLIRKDTVGSSTDTYRELYAGWATGNVVEVPAGTAPTLVLTTYLR